MEKTPPFKLVKTWTMYRVPDAGTWHDQYELTDEEKESLSPQEQETWKVLKSAAILDLEQEIMDMMSAEITKEIAAEILNGILSGTSTK